MLQSISTGTHNHVLPKTMKFDYLKSDKLLLPLGEYLLI